MPRDDFSKIDEEYFNTLLDEDFIFEGTIKHDESLVIKGSVKGKIESKGDLVIGPDAVINADISSRNLQCFGIVNGDITVTTEAFLHSSSKVNGNVSAPIISIEKGCKFNGSISMNT